MKTISKTVLIILMSFFIFSCDSDDDNETPELPNTILLKETSLYPEGIVYNEATQKTFVGSYYKGKIVTVDINGNMNDFIIDETLVAVVGMAIDKNKNRLLVCNSDAGISLKSDVTTTGILAEVIVYDLTTREKLKTIDLSGLYQGGHFLNDLVQDNEGNTYVTDSFSPVIYKIDTNDVPTVFINNALFESPQGTFGLNGIVYHSDNYLIVGKAYGGKLYKVTLDNSDNVQEITLNTNVNSLDGLLLADNNTLILVSNYFAGPPFEEAIYKIKTSDTWSSGNVISAFTALNGKYPTTLTKINNQLYVNFGYFPELVDPNSTPNDNFKLQKVNFSN